MSKVRKYTGPKDKDLPWKYERVEKVRSQGSTLRWMKVTKMKTKTGEPDPSDTTLI